MSENNHTAVALYQGVEVQQAAYMAAFSQPDGMTDIIQQICEQAQAQAAEIGADMKKAAERAFNSLSATKPTLHSGFFVVY